MGTKQLSSSADFQSASASIRSKPRISDISGQNANPRTFSSPSFLGLNLSLPMSRREAVRLGLFSTAGLLLADGGVMGAAEAPVNAVTPIIRPKAKSVIQIFLWGG